MLTFSDLRGQGRTTADLPLFDVPAQVRTFDAPEFQGVTFYEVEAKSLLNRVPSTGYLSFEWTINVYRGCSHACTYCVAGDTPILLADGRTKPLAEVRAGDAIYGTVLDGNYRRYVITEVLAHWRTVKPAFRVVLEDGTSLVASGDHRFLSDRGWKHVTGAEHGSQRRPHLTADNKLMGTGQFALPPKDGPEYRRGYLCGMIRGDGHRARLAPTDAEALRRARAYLAEVGIPEAVRWPHAPSAEWSQGFLAGIFDAEGSYSCGILRISNTDQVIVDQITSCLRRFGFSLAVEKGKLSRAKPLMYIRLLGGLREHLRFFHTVDPAITRKRAIEGQAIEDDGPLRVASVEPLGFEIPMFDITTGTGDFIANGVISHNCFARPSHTYLNFDAGRDFETKVVVKVNAAEVLRRELRRPSWAGQHVAMGTNTDPYQRCEGRYRLTRAVLEVLRDFRNPCSVLTKSPLLLRDLDLFAELQQLAGFSASLSIGTLDPQVWRRSEPGTPHPKARMAAVRQLREAGIRCGVLVAPILPGISDAPAQLRAVVRAAAEAGASHVTPLTLHLRPGVKEEFLPWLEREYPQLLPDYQRMYRHANAPKPVRERITAVVRAASQRYPPAAPPPGAPAPATAPSRGDRWPRPAPEPPAQLTLGFD